MTSDAERQNRQEMIDAAVRVHAPHLDVARVNNEGAIRSGSEATKAIAILNGGAAVTLLTFVGNGHIDLTKISKIAVMLNVALFLFGAFLAAAASALSYFTNYCYTRSNYSVSLIYVPPFV